VGASWLRNNRGQGEGRQQGFAMGELRRRAPPAGAHQTVFDRPKLVFWGQLQHPSLKLRRWCFIRKLDAFANRRHRRSR